MLYGKYRPQGFDEVVGQDHIVTTLRNALASGQIAHAYLFSGPRGTGKTTTARILARAVNCGSLKGGDPCNDCESCEAIGKGRALDLIEMDAASNRGIDDIRELREKIAFAPSDLKMKVYLLDEVHMLTQGAFNALLKTLEEPPPHAIFILATTELHEVPATVQSRCQRHDFHRVNNDAMVGRLERICAGEGFNVPREGLTMMAIQSRGGARDAITLLEQVTSRYGNSPSTDDVLDALGLVHDERSEKLARAILQKDLAAALDIAREVSDDGIDIARFTRSAIDALRAILPQVLRGRAEEEGQYQALAQETIAAGVRPAEIANAISELAKADFRLDPGSPIPLEMACAAAAIGPQVTHVVAADGAPQGAHSQPARPTQGQRAPAGGSGGGRSEPATPEERFARQLYEQCKVQDPRLSGWLNDSFRVLAMEGEELELGFKYPMHMDKVAADCRTLVEQQAEAILNRKVVLKVRLLTPEEKPAGKGPAAKGGHLAKVAETLGGVPVGKE